MNSYRGTRLTSLVQLHAATLTFIFMLCFNDAIGTSRLHRMPSFYGKRSEQTNSLSKMVSPTFGIADLEKLLSSAKDLTANGRGAAPPTRQRDLLLAEGEGLYDQAGEDEDFLKNYILGQYRNEEGGFKEKRMLENGQSGEKDLAIKKMKEIAEYDILVKTIMDVIRKLQDDLIVILGEEEKVAGDMSTESRDWDPVLSHPAPPLKRGTLLRLPQFYGRRK